MLWTNIYQVVLDFVDISRSTHVKSKPISVVFVCMIYLSREMFQDCHTSGGNQGKVYFFRFREMSENFEVVREKLNSENVGEKCLISRFTFEELSVLYDILNLHIFRKN